MKFRVRKITKKTVTGDVSSGQLTNVQSQIDQISSRVSANEDEIIADDATEDALATRVTSLETSQTTQDTEIGDLISALNNPQNTNQYMAGQSATVTATAAGTVTASSTLFAFTNNHTTGDGWDIELFHATYTSNAWSNAASILVPSGTSILVRAVLTGTSTLLSASTVPRLLAWTGALSGTTNSTSVIMPSSNTSLGANITSTNGEEMAYSVTSDTDAGVFTTGTFRGKVTVTISGWTNTYGGSGLPIVDAFYRLDGWYDDNSEFHPSSKSNYKMQMNWGDTSQTGDAYWDYPLGDGANNSDSGYPAINWSPASNPSTSSNEDAIIGASGNRNAPAEGTNEYTFTLDLADGDKAGNSTTDIRLGFRTWAGQSAGWTQGLGGYWIKVEPVSGQGTWTPPS
tara:strand:- start:1282 stop:2481 length:1200 start_codon:yes stop_codon:yes gene_type:complete